MSPETAEHLPNIVHEFPLAGIGQDGGRVNQILFVVGPGAEVQRSTRILESVCECLRLSLLFFLLIRTQGIYGFESGSRIIHHLCQQRLYTVAGGLVLGTVSIVAPTYWTNLVRRNCI